MRDQGSGRGAPRLRIVRGTSEPPDGSAPDDPFSERVALYLDGELDDAATEELMDHLVSCTSCQDVLHFEVQLRDRLEALRNVRGGEVAGGAGKGAAAAAHVATEANGEPRARRWPLWVGAPLAMAAAVTLYVAAPRSSGSGAPVLALGPQRTIEARLSWPGAARHRPYHTMRAAATIAGERIDPEDVARLARGKDCAGVAAAYVLAGELRRAELQYAECPPSPDLDADRAGLAVASGEPDAALELADSVLAKLPNHSVALWNRALALRDLGLGLAAAAMFDQVAALSDDWAEEARAKATALREPIEQARRDWHDVLALGDEMVAGGAVLPDRLARAVPARARMRLHDALRTATTATRIEELRPLAVALERATGDALTPHLEDAKRRLAPGRAKLVPMYIELLKSQGKVDQTSPAWRAWRAQAKALGASDLLLGAAYLTDGGGAEAEQLARATKDPWFIGLVEAEQIVAKLAAGDRTGAAARVRSLEAMCQSGAPAYICLLHAGRQAIVAARPAQTAASGRAAMTLGTASGEFLWRFHGAFHAAEGERQRGHHSAARGYYEELILLSESCEQRRLYAAAIALLEVARDRFAVASEILRTHPACSPTPPLAELALQAHMREAGQAIDEAPWRAGLRAVMENPASTPGERMYAEYLVLRADLEDEPGAREALRQLITRTRAVAERNDKHEMAKRAKAGAEMALFLEETRRGAWRAALDTAATSQGVEAPARCALALARSGPNIAAVMVGPDAQLLGRHQIDREWALPEDWRTRLAPCEEIEVLAFPRTQGQPALPPTLPWAYRSRGPARPDRDGKAPRALVVANSKPPAGLALAPLAPVMLSSDSVDLVVLTGATATRRRVEAEAMDASFIEFHVHTARAESSDVPVLALSESPDGWELTAEQIEHWQLLRAPVVLLADCGGAVPAAYDHIGWGLPAAFRRAGARAVVAVLTDIPDGEGNRIFAELRTRLAKDANVARVVSKLRAEKIAADPTSWVRHIVVFQ